MKSVNQEINDKKIATAQVRLEEKYKNFCNAVETNQLNVSLCIDIDDACVCGGSHTNVVVGLLYNHKKDVFYVIPNNSSSGVIEDILVTSLKHKRIPCPKNMLDTLAELYVYGVDSDYGKNASLYYTSRRILDEIANQLLYPLVQDTALKAIEDREKYCGLHNSKVSLDYKHGGAYCLGAYGFDIGILGRYTTKDFPQNTGSIVNAPEELVLPDMDNFRESVRAYYGDELISGLSFEQDSQVKDIELD